MFLYKYISINSASRLQNLKSLLDNGQIWASSIDFVNDPYEGVYSELDDSDYIHPKIKSTKNIIARLKMREYLIICLSKKVDSHLMWAHYAEKHTGICIKFNSKKCKKLSTAEQVKYVSLKPPLNFKRIPVRLTNRESPIIRDLLLKKFRDWNYEKEYRVLINRLNFNLDKAGDYVFLNPESIESIYLGKNINLETARTIYDLCLNKKIKIFKYSGHSKKYEMEFNELFNKNDIT